MTDTPVSPCPNCDQPIGKLENTFPWAKTRVCWDCYKKLTEQQQSFATERDYPRDTPKYSFLSILIVAYMIIGIAALILGPGGGLLMVLIGSSTSNRDLMLIGLVILLYGVIGGIILCGFGQLMSCIRDIARNSWLKK